MKPQPVDDVTLDRALQLLRVRGDMRAKDIAKELGLPNARSLSLRLQYCKWCEFTMKRKWRVMNQIMKCGHGADAMRISGELYCSRCNMEVRTEERL
jgi:hypothetical protein